MRSILFLILFFLNSFFSFSQEYNLVNYKVQVVSKEGLDTIKDSKKQTAKVISNLLKNNVVREYELIFNEYEANFKQLKRLDINQSDIFNTNNFDILYLNIKGKYFYETKEVFGKVFLIKDDLDVYEWELTEETKLIMDKVCYKAKLNINENDKSSRQIIAWYCPDIKVSFGPIKYYGLPGLILEIVDGNISIFCYNMEYKKNEKISKPNKGEVVTQKEFDKIVNEKIIEAQGFKTSN